MTRSALQNASRFLLPILAIAAVGCSPSPTSVPAAPVVAGLRIARATALQIPAGTRAVGTVRATESASMAAQTTGRVVSVPVHEGDTVRAGQVLVRLDSAAARADVARAKAEITASQHQVELARTQADLAASTLTRYQVLRDRKSVSPQEFDEVSRRSQAASAALEAAQSQLEAARAAGTGAGTVAGYSVITAPFGGIITGRHVDPGALATPGTPLIDIDRAGVLQLHTSVDESLVRNLKLGQPINTEIPSASPDPLKGIVAAIVPAADPSTHSFLVKINLPAAKTLRAGMYGNAILSGATKNAIVIPQSALVTHGSLNSVWVVDDRGIASLRYITIGAQSGGNCEVLSGLAAGERVILDPGDRELGGSRIEGSSVEVRP